LWLPGSISPTGCTRKTSCRPSSSSSSLCRTSKAALARGHRGRVAHHRHRKRHAGGSGASYISRCICIMYIFTRAHRRQRANTNAVQRRLSVPRESPFSKGVAFLREEESENKSMGLLSHSLPQGAANAAGQSQVLSGPTDSAARPKPATRIWGTCRRSHRALYMHLDISLHVRYAGSSRRPCVACRACDERGFRKLVGLSG
jgi:hypothetical protein